MGTIQNSLNQILASSLGVAFAVTQSPGVKRRVEDKATLRALERAEKVEAVKTETAQRLGAGGLPVSEAMKVQEEKEEPILNAEGEVVGYEQLGTGPAYGPETLIPVAEQEQSLLEAQQAVNEQRIRMGKKKTPGGITVGGQAYSLTQQQREQEQIISRLQEALEAKQGVQEAVPNRKKLLSQYTSLQRAGFELGGSEEDYR